jgi:hypothetical protein
VSLKDPSSSTGPIPWRKAAALLIGLAALFPVATWIAWSPFPYGTELLNLVGIGPICLAPFAALLVPFGLVLALFARWRRLGLRIAVFSASWAVGTFAGIWLSLPIQRAACLRTTVNAVPLVEAIHAFEAQERRPPSSLQELVPKHLSLVPSTGIGSHPKFRFQSADGTSLVMGDRWALHIQPPQVVFGFDRMFYVPSKAYPQRGYGGWIERVGDWAYVHE